HLWTLDRVVVSGGDDALAVRAEERGERRRLRIGLTPMTDSISGQPRRRQDDEPVRYGDAHDEGDGGGIVHLGVSPGDRRYPSWKGLLNVLADAIVYVVDDDPTVRRSLARLVRTAGLKVETFPSADAFLAQTKRDRPACLVLDVRLPGLSGLELQSAMGRRQLTIPIIFITGRGNVPMSVRAMKEGAVDFLEKPFDSELLLAAIHRALLRS